MKKTKKDDESYYAIYGFIAATFTVLIHYFLLAHINIHPSIHVAIGILIFFLVSAIISSLLAKCWNKKY